MKIKTIILLSFVFFVTGCEKFMDKKPLGVETSESFLGNPEKAEQNFEFMVRAGYEVMNFTDQQTVSMNGGIVIPSLFGDMMSDDGVKGGNGDGDQTEYLNWRRWQASPSGQSITNIYTKNWIGIARANAILKSLEQYKDNLSKTAYNRIKGEALFLRAFFYYDNVLYFAKFPYFDHPVLPEEFKATKSDQPADIYKNIDQDLTEAKNLVLEKSQWQSVYNVWPNGRATKGAVEALLAKVIAMEIGFNFNGRTYQDLYDITNELISSNEYSLMPNFAIIYENPDGENCAESIFEIQCADLGQGYGTPGDNLEPRMLSPRLIAGNNNGKNLFSGWGFDCPTQDLYDEFEAGDPRRECSIIKSGDVLWDDGDPTTDEQIDITPGNINCPTGYFNRKKSVPITIATSGSNANYNVNMRVFRYGDILLLHAEAAYQTGKEDEARQYVNKIRERARKSTLPKGFVKDGGNIFPPASTDPNLLPDITATGTDLLKAIRHERRVELAMEASRTHDLLRWGIYEEALQKFVPADRSLATTAESVIANFRSHLVNGVPAFPIPTNEVAQFGFEQNPGY